MKVFYSDHFVLPLPEGHRFPMVKYSMLRERVAQRWDLRPGRAPDATRGNGRGDPARPRPRLPETRGLRKAHGQGGPAHRFPVVGEDGRALPPRLGRHARGLPRRPRRGLRREPRGGDAPRVLRQGRGILRLQRLCHRRPRRPGRRSRGARGRHRHGRPPGERDGSDPARRPYGVYVLGPRRKELPLPQRGERPRRAPPRRRRTTRSSWRRSKVVWRRRSTQRTQTSRIYLAGADPFEGDRLGRLSVTKAGLAERDRIVLETCRERGIPVAVTMAGGYACEVEDTVEIHFQ